MKKRIFFSIIALIASTLFAAAVEVNLNFYADGRKIHTQSVEADGTYTLSDISVGDIPACRDWSFYGWSLDMPESGVVDASPAIVTSVTPSGNLNLYAVYRKDAGTSDNYIKISGIASLVSADYIFVYEDEGTYYALGKTEYISAQNSSYYSVYKKLITDISADGSQITKIQPDSLVWQYTVSDGAYGTWKNRGGSNIYLAPYYSSKKYHLLTSSSTTMRAQWSSDHNKFGVYNGNYNVDYSNNEFICEYNSEYYRPKFHFYKKTVVPVYSYTSYPHCSLWSTHLDAGLGTIGDGSDHIATVTESNPGETVTLPTATQGEEFDCETWSFYGWHRDTPVERTTSAPTIISSGSGYSIPTNGEHLFAVYNRGAYYQKISSRSELSEGDECVIVYTDGSGVNHAITFNNYTYSWEGTNVTILEGRILSAGVTDYMKWTYKNSSNNYFYCGSDNDSHRLAYGGNSSQVYNPTDQGSSLFKLINKGYSSYTLRWTGSAFQEKYNDDTNNTFTIYKKIATTYTSWPHCKPYTVTLHACGGYMTYSASEVANKQLTEEIAGAGVTIPSATPRCPEDGWSFVGWIKGEDLGSVRKTEMTAGDGIIAPGAYIPSHEGEHLYAVYKRFTDYYRIVSYPENMVAGDKYILTYYTKITGDDSDNTWDVELTSDVISTNYLAGDPKDAPQDANSYYMVESNAKSLWILGGSEGAWTFESVNEPGKYLSGNTSGHVFLDNTPVGFHIDRPTSSLNLQIYANSGNSYHYFLYFDEDKFRLSSSTSGLYTEKYDSKTESWYYSYYYEQCFLYRQMSEFSSWPHCDPFTVYFEGCGGTAGYTSKTESAPYAGITLPNAYVNGDCAHEGWLFAGWSKYPVNEETDVLTQNLYPAGIHYVPMKKDEKLYAVYYSPENSYKQITSLANLRLGVNYIIADDNNAMKNLPKNTDYIDYQTVSPSDGVITLDDAEAIEWRLQGEDGMFEIYNVKRDVFLDLRTSSKALLTRSTAEDKFQITKSSSKFIVRSNMSIVNNTGAKYLGFDGTNTRFTTLDQDHAHALYFYQRQALYNSYPQCVDPIEPLRWTDDNHVIMESFVLTGTPELSGGIGSAVSQPDGTYSLSYNPSILTPCSNAMVSWGDGTSAYIHVPWIVKTDANMSSLGIVDCASCDAVVLPGATLTINENKTMHNITVYEGGKLHINNGVTLTLNTLTMRCDDDTKAPQVTFGGETARLHLMYDEMYYDTRIDDKRYYWIALPFDTYVQSISFANEAANGKIPEYRTDYWVKSYDGAQRAADVNAGKTPKRSYWTHVAPKGQNALMPAGQGYNICIADQAPTQADGRYHSKRVLRFSMHPNDDMWNEQEYTSAKVTGVTPSTVDDPNKQNHAGWNLIGNPYLKNYNTGTVTGLRNGSWEHLNNENGDWTGRWQQTEGSTSVPYFTIFDPLTETYSQVLASDRTLLPFSAVFVQIEDGNQINFADDMSGASKAPYRRAAEKDEPLFTGIVLEGNTYADKTGIVLDERFTPAYEIGGDLEKIINSGRLNLYTLNANGQALAFNGLSDEDAVAPIPVGVTFPQSGEYTFAFDAERFSINALDSLILIDYMADSLETNLLYANYTFETEAGTVNNRFAIVVRRAAEQIEITTDIPAVETDEQGAAGAVYKFIHHGKLYIKYGDKLFDASGVQVR